MAKGKAIAISAGTRPAAHMDRGVIETMRESDIDISQQRPKALSPELLEGADRVITMGCNIEKACLASFVPTEDWKLEDPEGQPIEKIRKIRDEIKARVEVLIHAIDFGWLS
jgi:protein-tyrosine-phosphatase